MEKSIDLRHSSGTDGDRSRSLSQEAYTYQDEDSNDMLRMGKEQKFRRNFKVVSITSFCLATMMGFVFIPLNGPLVIEVAGTGGTIVLYIVNFFAYLSVVLSLAEMSSIAPTAGGQYHWVSEFAPPSLQKVLSYLSGWLSSLSWMVGVASGLYLIGNLIPALIALTHPDFTPHAWQGYLFVWAIGVLIVFVNACLAKYLPLVEKLVLCITLASFVLLLAVPLAMSPNLLPSADVFQSFPAQGSTGILEVLGSQSILFFCLLGSDSTAHMAEETQHANIVIPRAMVGSYVIMGIMSFSTLVGFSYCLVDPDTAFGTDSGYPFLQVYMTATGSTQGAVGLASISVVLVVLSAVNFTASTSRQVFAFARDNGLPFSDWISRVNSRTLSPINSLLLVFAFTVLISLIGLGSTVAFNAIVSLQVMAIASTYELSMLCMIWRRLRGKPLPPAPWSLGRFGLITNIAGAVYVLYLLVYAAMPPVYPVRAANLNWAPVIFGAVLILSQLYYFVWARKIYEGPVVYVKAD